MSEATLRPVSSAERSVPTTRHRACAKRRPAILPTTARSVSRPTTVAQVARRKAHRTREGCGEAPLRNHRPQPNNQQGNLNNVVPYAPRGSETGMTAMRIRPYQRGSTLACKVATP